jgi:hypothetical protein
VRGKLPGGGEARSAPRWVGLPCCCEGYGGGSSPNLPVRGSMPCCACCDRTCRRYYDLAVLRQEFGTITGYTDPKPGRYHDGCRAGDLSQTGQVRGPGPHTPLLSAGGPLLPGRLAAVVKRAPACARRSVSCCCGRWWTGAATTRRTSPPGWTGCWPRWMAAPTAAATQTWRCGMCGAGARCVIQAAGLLCGALAAAWDALRAVRRRGRLVRPKLIEPHAGVPGCFLAGAEGGQAVGRPPARQLERHGGGGHSCRHAGSPVSAGVRAGWLAGRSRGPPGGGLVPCRTQAPPRLPGMPADRGVERVLGPLPWPQLRGQPGRRRAPSHAVRAADSLGPGGGGPVHVLRHPGGGAGAGARPASLLASRPPPRLHETRHPGVGRLTAQRCGTGSLLQV